MEEILNVAIGIGGLVTFVAVILILRRNRQV